MLLFGTVTGGLAYTRKLTLTDAARVGARYGTTHPFPTTAPPQADSCSTTSTTTGVDQWLVDVACETIANAQGELNAGTSGRVICVSYTPAGTDLSGASSLEWDATNSGTVQSGQTCPQVAALTPSSADAIVQVVVQRTADFDAVVWNQSLTLQSQALGRYEQVQPS